MKNIPKITATLLISLLFAACTNTKIAKDQGQGAGDFRVMFYNVENLFDTVDDPEKKDEEFTPEGNKHWNEDHYKKKLSNISQVITAVGGWDAPAIVGLCEVENLKVLEDLTNYTGLSKLKYSIVHKESPDNRGIDVALLYRKDVVEPISYKAIPVKLGDAGTRPTRDILYFKGVFKRADTIHFFVNHWPSRYGGHLESAPKRMKAALALHHVVDSILSLNANANIIITGDFNDDPEDESLVTGLGAVDPAAAKESRLYNLSAQYKKPGVRGSLKYKGNWNVFDQFVVSSGLLNGKGKIKTAVSASHIFYGLPENEFLLEVDDRYQGLQPNRTYWGRTYHDGFSDHLPVYLDLFKN